MTSGLTHNFVERLAFAGFFLVHLEPGAGVPYDHHQTCMTSAQKMPFWQAILGVGLPFLGLLRPNYCV